MLMSHDTRDTLEQEVKLVVYNIKMKPAKFFNTVLKIMILFFERKEAFIRKGFPSFLIKYLCSRRFLSA